MRVPKDSESEAAPTDVAKMSKIQKLAALLVIIGTDGASEIIKNLDEHELDQVAVEMARYSTISHDLQRDVLREFSSLAVEATTCILGGIPYAQEVLEKSIGPFRASSILGRVSPGRPPVAVMHQIAEMEPRQLHNLLKGEQPQTIALVMSYLGPERGAQLLALLPTEIREKVVERIASLAPTPIEVVEKVIEVLNAKIGAKQTRALHQTGGIKNTADLLKALDKNSSKSLLVALEEHNPELAANLRQRMFTFEDLIILEVASLQKIMREIDMRDLALALKNATEKLKKAILSCMSKRAAETVNEEMNFMSNPKPKEVDAAQQRIIEGVRRLESEGEIDLDPNNNQRNDA